MVGKQDGFVHGLVLSCDPIFRWTVAHLVDNSQGIGLQCLVWQQGLVPSFPVEKALQTIEIGRSARKKNAFGFSGSGAFSGMLAAGSAISSMSILVGPTATSSGVPILAGARVCSSAGGR